MDADYGSQRACVQWIDLILNDERFVACSVGTLSASNADLTSIQFLFVMAWTRPRNINEKKKTEYVTSKR